MDWIPRKRRKRGRPRKTWMEGVQEATTTRNLEPDHWRNREEWRLVSGRWRQVTRLSIPTHAQLQRHRLKFIKNHLKKTPTCFGLRPSSGSFNILAKITIILTTVGCFYAKSGDVAACRVVCIGLYLKSVRVYVF